MDIGLTYMYTGMVYRIRKPSEDLEETKKKIIATVEEMLVRDVWFETEMSEGRDCDPVPKGEEYLKLLTNGYSDRWTRKLFEEIRGKISFLSGGEVTLTEYRPYVLVNGKKLYEDFMDEMNPPMYLFFDIDGVLNKESMWKENYSLDEGMVSELCLLCFFLHAWPILISSWRTGFDFSCSGNNSEPILRLEEMMRNHNSKILGKTEILKGRKREAEINRYRMLHDESLDYIILDDDPGEYGVIDKKTYFTDPKKGLTKELCKEILHKHGVEIR